ncbi:hypothetical protein Q5530_10750 [Saccharothrix sp. BKS2]|uniref:LPXTG-motif cell wall-anchored protein n=1 Tax=Saccharothrix lopnurensis TaxID=1670621 RepID=A0ABW1P3C4_9PSEU
MWRSVLAVCLLVLAGALTVSGTAASVPSSPAGYAAQPTDAPAPGNETLQPGSTVGPGPDINAPQEPAPANPETRKKLWLGGIALLLFGLVYWRNKKRWTKWRAGRKS